MNRPGRDPVRAVSACTLPISPYPPFGADGALAALPRVGRRFRISIVAVRTVA